MVCPRKSLPLLSCALLLLLSQCVWGAGGQCLGMEGLGWGWELAPGDTVRRQARGLEACRRLCVYWTRCRACSFQPATRLCLLSPHPPLPIPSTSATLGGGQGSLVSRLENKTDCQTGTKPCDFRPCTQDEVCAHAKQSTQYLCLLQYEDLTTPAVTATEDDTTVTQITTTSSTSSTTAFPSDDEASLPPAASPGTTPNTTTLASTVTTTTAITTASAITTANAITTATAVTAATTITTGTAITTDNAVTTATTASAAAIATAGTSTTTATASSTATDNTTAATISAISETDNTTTTSTAAVATVFDFGTDVTSEATPAQEETTQATMECPNGAGYIVVEGECFWVNPFNWQSWWDSKDVCDTKGGQLFSVESTAKATILFTILADHFQSQNDYVWLGCSDAQAEGTWVWESGASFQEALGLPWQRNQPDNSMGGSDCCYIRPGQTALDDAPCKNRMLSICHFPS